MRLLMFSKLKSKDNNIIRNKHEKVKLAQEFNNLRLPIKLPKLLIQSIEFIVFITNRIQNELLTDFIVEELESYLYEHDSTILSIVEKSGLLERLRLGLNQYYGDENHLKLEKEEVCIRESIKIDIINLEIELPEKLISFIRKYCEISNMSIEDFMAFLIVARLHYIYSSPEVIFNYIKNVDNFFEDLKEGVKDYHGKTIIQQETHQRGET